MLIDERVVETVMEHAVEKLAVAHAITPAALLDKVGRLVHILHPARDSGIRQAQHDLLRGSGDRLGSGAADPVDGHRRHSVRDSATDRRLPRRVHLRPGLHHLAHDDRIDRVAGYAGALERLGNGDTAESRRGHVLEAAAIASDRGSHGCAKNNIPGHDLLLPFGRFRPCICRR